MHVNTQEKINKAQINYGTFSCVHDNSIEFDTATFPVGTSLFYPVFKDQKQNIIPRILTLTEENSTTKLERAPDIYSGVNEIQLQGKNMTLLFMTPLTLRNLEKCTNASRFSHIKMAFKIDPRNNDKLQRSAFTVIKTPNICSEIKSLCYKNIFGIFAPSMKMHHTQNKVLPDEIILCQEINAII